MYTGHLVPVNETPAFRCRKKEKVHSLAPLLAACKKSLRGCQLHAAGWCTKRLRAVCAQGFKPGVQTICVLGICFWAHISQNISSSRCTIQPAFSVSRIFKSCRQGGWMECFCLPPTHKCWVSGIIAKSAVCLNPYGLLQCCYIFTAHKCFERAKLLFFKHLREDFEHASLPLGWEVGRLSHVATKTLLTLCTCCSAAASINTVQFLDINVHI